MFAKLLFLLALVSTEISFALNVTESGQGFKFIAEATVILLFGMAMFKNLSSKFGNSYMIKRWGLMMVIIGFFALYVPDYATKTVFGDLRETFIPFAIAYSSYWLLKLDRKDFKIGVVIISVVGLIAAYYILTHSGGFEIERMYRSETNKNQTASFFAQIGLIALAFGLENRKKFLFFVGLVAVYILLLAFCMILRCRTASLLMIAAGMFLLYKEYGARLLCIVPVLVVIVGYFYGDQISDFFYASVIDDKDISNVDTFTSGRASLMKQSGDIILSNPFLGSLSYNGSFSNVWTGTLSIVHNYVMYKWVKYGIIFSLPWIIIYLSIIANAFGMYKRGWVRYKYALICLLIAFGTSLAEYSAPFGPGTAFIICYIFYGMDLRIFTNEGRHIRRFPIFRSV